MSYSRAWRLPWFTCVAALAVFGLAPGSRAQMQLSGQTASPNLMVHDNEMQTRMELSNMDALGDKDQVKAYKAFVKEPEPVKKIQLGSSFLENYPKSAFTERVDIGMMSAYDERQDWKNTYLFADKALALQPDDVDALTTVAWTIPHVYDPNDSDADQQLDKAEKYAKHAIDVIPKTAKPPGMNDAQFEATRTKRTIQARSALGLVYFRRDDYDNSTKELQLATTNNPAPDPTDLYVLGVDLQNLQRFDESADAFGKCSQIAGPLQQQCEQSGAEAKARSDLAKIKQ
jgi:tetratricopeptide (TPR) repeat protein